MDGIPVFSQVKSLVQAAAGQKIKAKETQENFSRQCPIISQSRSFVEWAILKDEKAAQETQKQCGKFVSNFVDGIPVVGHIKGTVHYAVGDRLGGESAMKAASRTTVVIAGATGGFFAAGPPGAVGVAIATGAAYDTTVTAIDSARHKRFHPYGVLEPIADPKDAGKWCDAIGGIAMDGLTGFITARSIGRIQTRTAGTRANATPRQIVGDVVTNTNLNEGAAFKPSKFFTQTKSIVVKAHAGCLYLLKDGRVLKIKEELFKKIEEYKKSTMNPKENISNDKETINSTSDYQTQWFQSGDSTGTGQNLPEENQVKHKNLEVCLSIGKQLIVFSQGKTFIIQPDGTSSELLENQSYELDEKSNEINPVTNTHQREYIDSEISRTERRLYSIDDDLESLYYDANVTFPLDTEPADDVLFTKRYEEVNEQPGLLFIDEHYSEDSTSGSLFHTNHEDHHATAGHKKVRRSKLRNKQSSHGSNFFI